MYSVTGYTHGPYGKYLILPRRQASHRRPSVDWYLFVRTELSIGILRTIRTVCSSPRFPSNGVMVKLVYASSVCELAPAATVGPR